VGMQTEAMPKIRAEQELVKMGGTEKREAVKLREKQRWIITEVGTPAGSLKVRSSSEGLGRPRGPSSQLRE
jgi:hypothetical protein